MSPPRDKTIQSVSPGDRTAFRAPVIGGRGKEEFTLLIDFSMIGGENPVRVRLSQLADKLARTGALFRRQGYFYQCAVCGVARGLRAHIQRVQLKAGNVLKECTPPGPARLRVPDTHVKETRGGQRVTGHTRTATSRFPRRVA